MVCDAGMIVSLMMNGLCCIWQEHSEKERREIIRNDIRVEYLRHRIIEQELFEQRRRQMMMEETSGHYEQYYHEIDRRIANDEIGKRQKMFIDEANGSYLSTANSSGKSISSAPLQYMKASTHSTACNKIRLSRSWPTSSFYSRNNLNENDYYRVMGYSSQISLAEFDDDNSDDGGAMVDVPFDC
jgi:hypothetical protein